MINSDRDFGFIKTSKVYVENIIIIQNTATYCTV